MMRNLLELIGLTSILLNSSFAQQTWYVSSQSLPGVHFSDLPQAVAAASPGDEIRVYNDVSQPYQPGWTSYTAPIIDKPLRIVGFTVGSGPWAGVRGGIVILGLAAGERVSLSNLHMIQGSELLSGIVALNCAGEILFEDCIYFSSGRPGFHVRFENCAEVVLRGCQIQLGGAPIDVMGSSLLITSTTVRHADPLFGPPISFSQTAPGLVVMDSTVTITESLVEGSDDYDIWPQSSFVPRPGMIINSGTVRVGPGALVRGGRFLQQHPSYRAPGFQVTGPNATVALDARGTISMPPPSPTPVPMDIHTMAHGWITAGEPYTALVAGPYSGFAVLAVGDWLPSGMPTPLGSLQIDPMTLQVAGIVPLSPNDGRYLWSLTCPATAPVAHAFAFQAAVLSPTGAISLTVPSPFTVAWPNGVSP